MLDSKPESDFVKYNIIAGTNAEVLPIEPINAPSPAVVTIPAKLPKQNSKTYNNHFIVNIMG